MEDFASMVKKARQDKRLTLQAVAGKLGTHKGYISGIENKKVNPPSSKIVRKLAKLYELPVKKLLILAEIEKVDHEVREIMREGSLDCYNKRVIETSVAPSARQVVAG